MSVWTVETLPLAGLMGAQCGLDVRQKRWPQSLSVVPVANKRSDCASGTASSGPQTFRSIAYDVRSGPETILSSSGSCRWSANSSIVNEVWPE